MNNESIENKQVGDRYYKTLTECDWLAVYKSEAGVREESPPPRYESPAAANQQVVVEQPLFWTAWITTLLRAAPSPLPFLAPIRAIASAASATGSLDDFVKLCDILPGLAKIQLALCAPVIYARLDSSLIPDSNTLDLAWLLHLALIVPAAFADFWPRLWAWIDFLYTYWGHIPGLVAEERSSRLREHASIVVRFWNDPETAPLVCATRRMRVIISADWVQSLWVDREHSSPLAMTETIYLLATDMEDGINYAEVVEGVGGDYELARAICAHVALAPSINTEGASTFLAAGVALLSAALEVDANFWCLLLAEGIIPTLLSALKLADTISLPCLDLSLIILTSLLGQQPGYTWMAEALAAGLLEVLLSLGTRLFAQSNPSLKTMDLWETLVRTVLPGSLVSYSVVWEFKEYLSGSHGRGHDAFLRSESVLSTAWKALVTLAEQRTKILDRWEDAGRPTFYACDNMKCGKIEVPPIIRCCSACRSAHYCSPECQRVDWRDAHREVCDDLRRVRACHPEDYLPPRERAFMKFLLHTDFQQRRLFIALREVMFMHENPGVSFFVTFDYCSATGVAFCPCPRSAFKATHDVEAELPVLWDRVARSGGRMEMDVMFVGQTSVPRPRAFPLRTSSAAFHDGLRRIAGDIPRGATFVDHFGEVSRSVRALIKETDNMLELH
ncbi:hypothetical protein C8R46DRAFT_1283517 [Mycena filopes]|nr:hypothetical protein C8R46DRAFT_1283517 [Mycena filopes]